MAARNAAGPDNGPPAVLPAFPAVRGMCRLQSTWVPVGGATGRAAEAYIWPHPDVPPDDHVIRLARACAERRTFFFLVCCHEAPRDAIQRAVADAVPAGGKVVLQ